MFIEAVFRGSVFRRTVFRRTMFIKTMFIKTKLQSQYHQYHQYHQCQQGAVLIIAMVFLLIMTLFGISTMRGVNLNMQMANNEQLRIEASERTQALIDGVVNDPNNFSVTGGIGYTICPVGDASANCDVASITLPSTLTSVDSGIDIDYRIIRKGPEMAAAPALDEESASSASLYKATFFEVQASYDGSSLRQGRSEIAQGIMVLIPDS